MPKSVARDKVRRATQVLGDACLARLQEGEQESAAWGEEKIALANLTRAAKGLSEIYRRTGAETGPRKRGPQRPKLERATPSQRKAKSAGLTPIDELIREEVVAAEAEEGAAVHIETFGPRVAKRAGWSDTRYHGGLAMALKRMVKKGGLAVAGPGLYRIPGGKRV